MHSVMTSATAGAGFGVLFPIGIGLILAVITPLIAVRMYHQKRDEWRHINWITALYIIGWEGMATGLMYGGARNVLEAVNGDGGPFPTFLLFVGVLSVIAMAFSLVLVGSNLDQRRGRTLSE